MNPVAAHLEAFFAALRFRLYCANLVEMRTSIGHFSSRELLYRLNGNADLKTRLARNGLDADLASHILDDAVHNIEPKPGALADSLGSEKRLEDAGLNVCRNSRAVVGNFYEDKIVLARRADGQVPAAVHGARERFCPRR